MAERTDPQEHLHRVGDRPDPAQADVEQRRAERDEADHHQQLPRAAHDVRQHADGRHRGRLGHGHRRRRRLAVWQRRGERSDGRILVDVLHRDGGQAAGLADLGGEVREHQRIRAQVVEEVALHRDLVQPDDLGQRLGQHGFGRGRRGDVGLGRGAAAAPPRRGQRLPVRLAAGHHRDLGELLDVPRHHVPGQPAAQRRPDPLGVDRRARDGTVVGDKLGETRCRLVGAHHRLPDAGHLQQYGLDLRELDPEAADLDLGGRPVIPRVGARACAQRAPPNARLAEHHVGALLGVVGVDGDVGGADRQRREDRDVQVGGARGDADADPVAVADPGGAEHGAEGVDLAQQRGVVEHPVAVVDRRGTGVGAGGRLENVAQGPLRRRGARDVHRRDAGARAPGRGRHVWHAQRRRVEEGGVKEGCRDGGRPRGDGRDLLGHTVARRVHRDDRDPGGRGVGRGRRRGGRDERDPGGRGVRGLLRRRRGGCDDRNPGGCGVDRDRSRRPGRGDDGDR